MKALKLTHLDLSCNNISDDGFLAISKHLLKDNYRIEDIRLSYNKFRTQTAAREIGEAIKTCARLKRVEMKMCRIDDEIAIGIA